MDESQETLNTFQAKIEAAQTEAQESGQEQWVETSPAILAYYNRKGLGGAGYFIYKGIKVCEYGRAEAIINDESVPIGEKTFGKSEAKILGREDTRIIRVTR